MTLHNPSEKDLQTSEDIATALSHAEIDPVAAEKVAMGLEDDEAAVARAEANLEEDELEQEAADENDLIYEDTGIFQSFQNLIQAGRDFFDREIDLCREIIVVRVKRIAKAAAALVLAVALAIVGLIGLLVGIFIALIHVVGALGAGLIYAGVALPVAVVLVLVARHWLVNPSQ
ncbi:MAG: phage holin family protein [Zymomonas mobilis subsp. pomaceae]|uniref:Uncharacterized protein n=1 Tax=Zymomonas mobilis subsp. pomaceae (strain ATCC 29192 / DSM 22645 / JCM 10191 / CCUG 17912 / NBRC 13757 / NCIMB 11200 / NRRL B-4491 / Barker I) TaxID=579138 RepID=F8EVQ2_ZYMMT|nr:phage holin family protein [Zymomonas mobilis]AEI38389.1 hypothetical protein Zymop_1499 [Zymomonas mobilis subsp. pomaceae ATCC 29192]MDX5948079.1 phage holin family protein [Zymomonas mobilis subsp. pomaceae]GEB89408.1 hypothetical protein ZMO02_10450 [Zymomonas mobilis subsp. pomaceae]